MQLRSSCARGFVSVRAVGQRAQLPRTGAAEAMPLDLDHIGNRRHGRQLRKVKLEAHAFPARWTVGPGRDRRAETVAPQPHQRGIAGAQRRIGKRVGRQPRLGHREQQQCAVQRMTPSAMLPDRQQLCGAQGGHGEAQAGSLKLGLGRFADLVVALPALVLEFDRLDRDRVGVGIEIGQGLVLRDPAAIHLVGDRQLAGLVVDLR